jgi:hypothetical protein
VEYSTGGTGRKNITSTPLFGSVWPIDERSRDHGLLIFNHMAKYYYPPAHTADETLTPFPTPEVSRYERYNPPTSDSSCEL